VNAPVYWLLALLGGAAVAAQGAANASLGSRIGLHSALFVSTTIVWLFCIAFYVARGMGPLVAPQTSPWLYIGGFCGFLIISAAALAFPRIGPTAAIALFVAGQGATALIVEHFGLLGMSRVALSPARVVGVLLVLAGAFLLRRPA
jgi:transporter family-2 protein